MMKSTKQKKAGRLSALRVSALAVFATLAIGVSTPVFAQQFDAGEVSAELAIASDAMPAPAVSLEVASLVTPGPELPTSEDQADARTSLDKLSSELLNILVPTFVLLIGALATALLNWTRKRFKLDVSDRQIYHWSTIAEMAGDRAAEWARNKAKDLTEGETVPGPELLEVAANWGIDYGIAQGLPEIGRRKFEGLVESQLHVKRISLIADIQVDES